MQKLKNECGMIGIKNAMYQEKNGLIIMTLILNMILKIICKITPCDIKESL